jgi:hypothetical protein
MDPRERLWTAVGLALFAAAGLVILGMFYRQAGDLLLLRAAIAGVMILTAGTALLAVWRRPGPRGALAVVAVLVLFLAVAPAAGKCAGRLIRGPASMILDSALQVEVAAGFLAAGRNPYRETYHGTDLERWHRGRDVPPLHHLVYPPVAVLATLPLREASLAVTGVYDSRFLLLPAYVGAFVLCARARGLAPWGPLLLAAAFLNPLLLRDIHVGRGDTLVLLLWVLGLSAASRGRLVSMAVLFALAGLAKTTALPAALFAVAWASARPLWIGAWLLTSTAVVGPFLLWDAAAFVDDTVLSLAGIGPHAFPVAARLPFGVAGLAPDFPWWTIQIPLAGATAFVGLRRVVRTRSLADLGLSYAAAAAVFIFFSRLAEPAYYGALVSMAASAVGFSASLGQASAAPKEP